MRFRSNARLRWRGSNRVIVDFIKSADFCLASVSQCAMQILGYLTLLAAECRKVREFQPNQKFSVANNYC